MADFTKFNAKEGHSKFLYLKYTLLQAHTLNKTRVMIKHGILAERAT